jgi:hypothetical protein
VVIEAIRVKMQRVVERKPAVGKGYLDFAFEGLKVRKRLEAGLFFENCSISMRYPGLCCDWFSQPVVNRLKPLGPGRTLPHSFGFSRGCESSCEG